MLRGQGPLPGKLELARALRPFRQAFPSQHHMVLDVDATIRATAAAGHYFGLGTTGVIRGEPHEPLNWSLRYAVSRGMRLRYLDRQAYRRKTSPEIIDSLRRELGDFYLLPEGGSNALAVRGCAELTAEVTAA